MVISFLTELARRDPEAARRLLRQEFRLSGGAVAPVRERLGVSKRHLRDVLERLDMVTYPARVRARREARLRLPQIAEVDGAAARHNGD